MVRLLVWGGGPYHSMRAQSLLFKDLLSPLGFDLIYGENRSLFDPENLLKADVLMLMGADWSEMNTLKPEAWEDPSQARSHEPLSEKHWDSLQAYLQRGRPLFCHHTGLLSFDELEKLADIYDGRWIVGQSFHPERGEFRVKVMSQTHPITQDVEDFTTNDELYSRLRVPRRSEILLQSNYGGVDCPLAWAGHYGPSKAACLALGHDVKAYQSPQLRKFFVNTLQWLVQT